MSQREKLWVIVPVYNEQSCVTQVMDELWPALVRMDADITLCMIDDGSTDGTPHLLAEFANRDPRIQIRRKPNSGHGQSCVFGYKLALEAGADWVLQLDSDGQCDPDDLPRFWEARRAHSLVYGFRRWREDGIHRLLMSRILSALTFLATGVFVRDINVPYRLMNRETLLELVPTIPADFHMANMLIAVEQMSARPAHWIPIRFRQRFGGTSKQGGALKLLSRCREFLRQVRAYRRCNETAYTRVLPSSKTGEP